MTGKSAFQIWERARALEAQGVEIIHLELGEPDFDTPAHIIEAGVRAIQAGRTRYDSASGTLALRQAIAGYIERTRGMRVEPGHVLVTPGVKAAIFFAVMALIEAGDEVLVPDPGFSSYQEITRLAEGVPVSYLLHAGNGFQPDLAEIRSRITPRTKCIILNSPANPSGTIHTQEILEGIAEIALAHDLWVLSDEIYYQLYYTDNPPPSIFTLPQMAARTILMDGFSKPYAMTGWRLGFGIFPAPLVQPVFKIIVNDHTCLPPFIQDAGLAALEGSQDVVVTMREAYHRRRDLVMRTLDRIPNLTYIHPDGAFYIMIDISRIADGNAQRLANRMLDAGVALLPCDAFGDGGKGYLRLAFTEPEKQLERALARIETVLRNEG